MVAKINFRAAKGDAISFLQRAKTEAFKTMELQRIIPTLITLLEYEWLTGKPQMETEELDRVIIRIDQSNYAAENSELAFWLFKARNQRLTLKDTHKGYDLNGLVNIRKAAAIWRASRLFLYRGFAVI